MGWLPDCLGIIDELITLEATHRLQKKRLNDRHQSYNLATLIKVNKKQANRPSEDRGWITKLLKSSLNLVIWIIIYRGVVVYYFKDRCVRHSGFLIWKQLHYANYVVYICVTSFGHFYICLSAWQQGRHYNGNHLQLMGVI